MSWPDALRQARVDACQTQEELAHMIGISVSTYKRWERGDMLPHRFNVLRLCQVLGLSEVELGFESGELETSPPPTPQPRKSRTELPEPSKEHPSTYLVQDRTNAQEINRLQIQDQMATNGMGGVLAEQADPTQFTHVLDVGCGTGGWIIDMARAYPDIHRLVGVDISSTMLSSARAQAQRQGVSDRVEFYQMDALRMLEFPSASFDLINQRFGMSYLRTWDWPIILTEYRRIARHGGVVRITEGILIEDSSSQALLTLNTCLLRALYQAGHFFALENDGVTSALPQILDRFFLHVQRRATRTDHRVGTTQYEPFVEDLRLAYQTLEPFLSKWIQVPENYDELYAQMLQEMRQEDFFAIGGAETVWGSVP